MATTDVSRIFSLIVIEDNLLFCPTYALSRLWPMEGKRSRTYVMGILNATPDSFSDGGRHYSREAVTLAVEHALAMARDGADIVDIGGESTRQAPPRAMWLLSLTLFFLLCYFAETCSLPAMSDGTKSQLDFTCRFQQAFSFIHLDVPPQSRWTVDHTTHLI